MMVAIRKAVVECAKAVAIEHLDGLARREGSGKHVRDKIGIVAGPPVRESLLDDGGMEKRAVPGYPHNDLDTEGFGSIKHPFADVVEWAAEAGNPQGPTVVLKRVVRSVCGRGNDDRVEGSRPVESLEEPVDHRAPMEWSENLARKAGRRETGLHNGPCARGAG